MNLINYEEVSFPGLGNGFTINIERVAFSIGEFEIYWYGILIALGLMTCIILAIRDAKKNNFSSDLVYDIGLVAFPCALVGARLYFVLCEWNYYSRHLLSIFDTRSGGLAVYGGIIGAVLGSFIMLRIRKIPFATCADYCLPYIPLGQAIGRWGNFFNQEAFGTNTTLPWGMTSESVSSYLRIYCPDLDPNAPVHPTFLYESTCDFIIFLLLIAARKKSKHKLETSCLYLVFYGVIRFLIEGLRTDSLYIANTNLRTSQILSLILVIVGLLVICYVHYKDIRREPLPEKFLVPRVVSKGLASEITESDSSEVISNEVNMETIEEPKDDTKKEE